MVAAVFAFTILSAGTFSTEQSREAIYAGLEEVQGSIELRGNVVASAAISTAGATTRVITEVVFTLANAAGGNPVDFTTPTEITCTQLATTTSQHKVVIGYRDTNQLVKDIAWLREFVGKSDGDNLLEDGELIKITVPLSPTLALTHCTTASGLDWLEANTTFVIEVKPPTGSTLRIERKTPAYLDPVNDLR